MKEETRIKLLIVKDLVDSIMDFAIERKRNFFTLFSKLTNEEALSLKTNYENSIFHMAVQNHSKKSEIIQFLLDKGFDPNEQDLDGNTVLHKMLKIRDVKNSNEIDHFSLEIFNLLLKNKASLNIQNNLGQTPLMVDHSPVGFDLNKIDNFNIIDLDLSKQDLAQNTLLHLWAADVGYKQQNLRVLLNLIKQKKDSKEFHSILKALNLQNKNGDTVLIMASRPRPEPRRKRQELLQELIDLGVELNTKNKFGKSAVDYDRLGLVEKAMKIDFIKKELK